MKRHWSMTAMATAALALAAPAGAQDGDAQVRKDLGTVIALQGKPCGQVTEARRNAENDYNVTCESGERYRVRIDGDRVLVEPIG